MTGFGKATRVYKAKKITIEIRSLNGRYSEVNLKIPPTYKEKEFAIRQQISNSLQRGKIDCTITLEYEADAAPNLVNTGLLKAYHKQLSALANDLNIETQDLIPAILRIPQVLMGEKEELADEEWAQITDGLNEALNELMAFRTTEGGNLLIDVKKRAELIEANLEEIKKIEPLRAVRKKEALEEHLSNLQKPDDIDHNRFEEELIYYLEKQDITEEIVRLKSHLDGFNQLLDLDEKSKGKKLNFYSQEMGREINTIGSKANDAAIQKIVVSMKDDLEKIKEQLLNIL